MAFRLQWPTQSPIITQPFGVNWTGVPDFYTKFGLPGHEGIDFEAPRGSEIYACANGVISHIWLDGNINPLKKPYGNQIRIKHVTPEGVFETVYAHLHQIRPNLKEGDMVTAGDLIGFADSTGNSLGDHLHLMLKKVGASIAGQTSFPKDIMDPMPFLEPFGQAVAEALPLGGGQVILGFPALPVAFNNHYRLQTDEHQFRRAWAWAGGGGGNSRWLNLVAIPNAPYSDADARNNASNTNAVEDALQYLNPQPATNGTPRYWPVNSATFCNIFVNDATRILHCEIPNNPANTVVFYMLDWLQNTVNSGWRESPSGQEAQDSVNHGHVAIMIWSAKKVRDHVALVRPGTGRVQNGFFYPRVAQAGLIVSSDLDSFESFGSLPSNGIHFFLHE